MTNETEGRRVRSIKIVSGGQTGADRAALDAAMEMGLSVGGWCPAGRRAEDGRIPTRYPLMETPGPEYAVRTSWNVRDSNATLIFSRGELHGGTALTHREALRQRKPVMVIDPARFSPLTVRSWIDDHGVECLNIAGPRESEQPGIDQAVREAMLTIFGGYRGDPDQAPRNGPDK